MWVEKYGLYDATKDEKAALEPFDTVEDDRKMEPVVIDISRTYSLVSHERYADDAFYSGEVMQVHENFTSFGVDVWRIDVKVAAEMRVALLYRFISLSGNIKIFGARKKESSSEGKCGFKV